MTDGRREKGMYPLARSRQDRADVELLVNICVVEAAWADDRRSSVAKTCSQYNKQYHAQIAQYADIQCCAIHPDSPLHMPCLAAIIHHATPQTVR